MEKLPRGPNEERTEECKQLPLFPDVLLVPEERQTQEIVSGTVVCLQISSDASTSLEKQEAMRFARNALKTLILSTAGCLLATLLTGQALTPTAWVLAVGLLTEFAVAARLYHKDSDRPVLEFIRGIIEALRRK